jgi:four helix bundle protein
MGDFKKLRVWRDACTLADRVEGLARSLPKPERAWAFDQLVPAAHAIHENLAEGWGFDSEQQRLKYCGQAISTTNETEDELLALERKNLLQGEYSSLVEDARRVGAMLGALQNRIQDSIAKARAAGSRRATRQKQARAATSEPPSDTGQPAASSEPTRRGGVI